MNYSIVPALNAQDPPNKLDDTAYYQPLTSFKFKTINGVDTPRGTDTSVWDRGGKGWLTVATTHWEVLGYGDILEEAGGPGQWLVTHIYSDEVHECGDSVYSRTKEGNPEAVVRDILECLGGIKYEAVKRFAGEISQVLRNQSRPTPR